jgi:small subunit ribosomal protein S10
MKKNIFPLWSSEMSSKKVLRIRLKSFDHKLLDQAAQDIMSKIKLDDEDNHRIRGPFPLPTKINRWTVLRGPHVNKKSREQFERRTHFRVIDIINLGVQERERLQNFELPAGVSVRLLSINKN